MALTEAQLQTLRDEVGSAPDDATLDALFTASGSLNKVALDVLRPRFADALTAAGGGSVTIPGVIGFTAPSQPTLLAQQINRLEAAYAAETGQDDGTGLAASSFVATRTDRYR